MDARNCRSDWVGMSQRHPFRVTRRAKLREGAAIPPGNLLRCYGHDSTAVALLLYGRLYCVSQANDNKVLPQFHGLVRKGQVVSGECVARPRLARRCRCGHDRGTLRRERRTKHLQRQDAPRSRSHSVGSRPRAAKVSRRLRDRFGRLGRQPCDTCRPLGFAPVESGLSATPRCCTGELPRRSFRSSAERPEQGPRLCRSLRRFLVDSYPVAPL